MADYPKYEFYVLNYDINQRKVINYNIFRNWLVCQDVTENVEKYVNGKISLNKLREQVRLAIAWQERSRCEYEISVGDAFETDCSKLEKWDCYMQAFPNINLITEMCINKYLDWKCLSKTDVKEYEEWE